jgi:hypothetical protein
MKRLLVIFDFPSHYRSFVIDMSNFFFNILIVLNLIETLQNTERKRVKSSKRVDE